MDSTHDQPKPSRRPRDRDPAQPTDLAERMIAFQRRNAATTRPRERPERTPSSPSASRLQPPAPNPPPVPSRSFPAATSPRKTHLAPHVIVSRPEADPEDFSRRLKISTSPRPHRDHSKQPHQGKLFNPNTDPIPMRRTAEPESISDVTSSSSPPRNTPTSHQRDPPANRHLFDHRKDDPVRFAVSVLARPSSNGARPPPTPKSSGDYVSASSTSSYAHSMTSSFTLSSGTTDNSSASSALFDTKPREDPSNNAFAAQLKKLYRSISTLETKILNEDADDYVDEGRVLLQGRGREVSDEDLQQQKWMKLISDHKRLAEMMHNLMEISLAPSVPASLRVIPGKYNIIIRLWTHAFHKLLEALRRASFSSPLALEHLQDFIYYAYTFYTGLLEEPTLRSFRSGWLEALGDLARYRMAVAAMVTNNQLKGSALTTDALSKAVAASTDDEPVTAKSKSQMSVKSSSDRPAARIDDSPSPSVGIVAARMMDVEPEKQRWRSIAKEWYAQGLADTPGAGKLHHHLGLLSREVDNEELRAVYHFVKSMTTLHTFSTSRESILPIWSSSAQSRRSQPDARVSELFVLLHGMLFTNIQLDDFSPTLARFLERIEIEGAEEREWIMMAVVNICAVLEYGRPGGVLRKIGGVGARETGTGGPAIKVVKKGHAAPVHREEDGGMDVDDEGDPQASPSLSDANKPVELPVSFKLAMELAFSMLSFVLRNPTRKASPFARSTLNPYLSVMLTFLATITKHAETLSVLERSIPWHDLAQFFATIPRDIFAAQGLNIPAAGGERWAMLTSGCAPPLPEDWCLRGMEWISRKVFERGYWKSGEERRVEIEILDVEEGGQLTDGIIEDEDEEEGNSRGESSRGETSKRWSRLVRCAVCLSAAVDGFTWVEGTREWRVEGVLEAKVTRWLEEDRHEREEEERRRRGRRWTDDSMDVDAEDEDADGLSEESEDDENDSEEVKALKARRRYLRSLLVSSQRAPAHIPKQRSRPVRSWKNASMPSLNIVAGYTILVLDTNIILSSLSAIASIIESLRWTVVLPVPVIMELDGLSSNPSKLGEAAQEAVAYITSHIRSHSMSLKVQTSKGNYLTSLSVRIEQVDLTDENSWDRCMDDLILKAAIWQDEHWVDRSMLLKNAPPVRDDANAVKVVLLSLDRLLRLKARSRQLAAAGEQDLAAILASGT
ncbi:uncharacterized protein EDB91DRAFT_1091560 [Suillus paluster]|uniref:uncharacterized protein n=1 Tax=Suillus paluster TaxID=48578 RepID=UPI001B86B4E8|nr:uncharacterized protein EDB91DRAFT_1091560 [Suillus paluster]KAG1756261.1 hypothetical protein EDB91DRAFT_1091560 [Suillus paluster]